MLRQALLWQSNASFNTVDYDTGILVATLQGLVNSQDDDRPLLFVDSFDIFQDWVGADRYWIKYLRDTKGVRFTNISGSGLDGLLAHTASVAGGAVLYGTPSAGGDPDGARYAALTLCGIEGLLPVTAALRAAHPALAALPVAHDLRGQFNSSAAAYGWALKELMPRVNRSVGWSGGRSHVGDAGEKIWQGGPPEAAQLGLDMAIARRGFVFNLGPNASVSASEAGLFDAVMAGLVGSETLPAIYGWSEPEAEYTLRVSKGGGYVLCSEAPNLSFWARLAAQGLDGALGKAARATPPPAAPPRNKVYVTFQTNEGDTPKIVTGLMGGSWLNPRRGAVPVAWGVDLVLTREFPALMQYYVATATANDSFFAGTSGGGYVYPSIMGRAAFGRYVAQAQALAAQYVAPPPAGAPADWVPAGRTDAFLIWQVPPGRASIPNMAGGRHLELGRARGRGAGVDVDDRRVCHGRAGDRRLHAAGAQRERSDALPGRRGRRRGRQLRAAVALVRPVRDSQSPDPARPAC